MAAEPPAPTAESGASPGDGRRLLVGRSLAGERVDRVVAMLCGVPRQAAADLVAAGLVSVNGSVVTTRSRKLVEGEAVDASVADVVAASAIAPDADIDVPVVFSNQHVIVVDKPAGMVVHPGAGRSDGTMVQGLLAVHPELGEVGDPTRPGVVHRLDAGTSGLLVVARTSLAYESLVDQLSSRTVTRKYLALVWGTVEAPAGLIDAPVGRSGRDRTQMAISATGREARTRYEVLQRYDVPAALTLVECSLETGRTHQVRVHLRALRHPVVGDSRYGGSREALPLGRPFLHAHHLEFDDPVTGKRLKFDSPLPADLKDVRELLQ
ncbi:MAG TPA: RluA family pseudouridine synthase [Acidimicrobiales bacterium]|nr:RluA family pseudouridine synthase [Acidimicrobiales bacterium]